MSPLEFLRRFTPQQRMTIRAASDPVIEDGLQMLLMAQEVNLQDQDTQFFVNYCAQRSLITQQEADNILGVE